MTSQNNSRMLAALYIRAILPALEDVGLASKKIQDEIKNWSFQLTLGVLGQESVTLWFHNGAIQCAERWGFQRLWIMLPTYRQFMSLIEDKGFFLPLPSGALWHLPKLLKFKKLADELEYYLEPHPQALHDPEFCRTHAIILFRMLMRATCALVACDPKFQRELSPYGSRLITFVIPDIQQTASLILMDQGIDLVLDEVQAQPDARIIFRDHRVFLQAAQQKLDNLAAVGRGDMVVEGLATLADSIGFIMDTVGHYLQPKS
jgi:hypothetical protein